MRVTIWKYDIEPLTVIDVPKDGIILDIQVQNGKPVMWILVNPTAEIIKRTFECHGTGHTFEYTVKHKYIGTFQVKEGGQNLVFHVFEVI